MKTIDDIKKHKNDIRDNILKSFNTDIEKARSGVYEDTAENRKLNRVGQQYGSKKEQEESNQNNLHSKQNEDNNSKNVKSVEDHAKNTSDETLKKVSENEKAPEDLRNAAKKELENRGNGKDKIDWDFDNKEELMGDDGSFLESTLKKNPIKAISGFVQVSALRAKYMGDDGSSDSEFLKNRKRVINKLFNKLDDSDKIKVLKKLDKYEKELIDF